MRRKRVSVNFYESIFAELFDFKKITKEIFHDNDGVAMSNHIPKVSETWGIIGRHIHSSDSAKDIDAIDSTVEHLSERGYIGSLRVTHVLKTMGNRNVITQTVDQYRFCPSYQALFDNVVGMIEKRMNLVG
jgi:hypothetical protein